MLVINYIAFFLCNRSGGRKKARLMKPDFSKWKFSICCTEKILIRDKITLFKNLYFWSISFSSLLIHQNFFGHVNHKHWIQVLSIPKSIQLLWSVSGPLYQDGFSGWGLQILWWVALRKSVYDVGFVLSMQVIAPVI